MRAEITLAEFLTDTGGTYQVTSTYMAGSERAVHCFAFPNESSIVSAPGVTEQEALTNAIKFVFGQVSLPTDQKAKVD